MQTFLDSSKSSVQNTYMNVKKQTIDKVPADDIFSDIFYQDNPSLLFRTKVIIYKQLSVVCKSSSTYMYISVRLVFEFPNTG